MRTVDQMIIDLDYWIFIGIGDDIYRCEGHRPEYRRIVNQLKRCGIKDANLPELTLIELKRQAKQCILLQPTFWFLLFLETKKLLLRIRRILWISK